MSKSISPIFKKLIMLKADTALIMLKTGVELIMLKTDTTECESYRYNMSTDNYKKLFVHKLFAYGIETASIVTDYITYPDSALLKRILVRYKYECDQWLDCNPPNITNAAKMYINIENILVVMSIDINTRYKIGLKTDACIKLSPVHDQQQLLSCSIHNRQLLSLMPYCWCCKYQPDLKKYCSDICNKQHEEFCTRIKEEDNDYE